ncbi:hypothetical protein RQP46_003058 [Phenoliferia psychrophenolica]
MPPKAIETLDVPEPGSVPPSSAFFLPPPTSDLMDRLQAFLPKLKSANEELAKQERPADEEESVVLEEVSSSEDDSDDSDDSSDDDSSDEDAGEGDESEDGGQAPLDRLRDIAARPKITRRRLAGQPGLVGGAGIVEVEPVAGMEE